MEKEVNSGEDKLLYSAGYDGVVKVWDITEGVLIKSISLVECLIYSIAKSTKYLFVSDSNYLISVYDIGSDYSFIRSLLIENNISYALKCVNEKHLVVGSEDNKVRVYNIECDFQLSLTFQAHKLRVFSIESCASYLYTGGEDKKLKIWSIENLFQLEKVLTGHLYGIYKIVIHGDLIISGGYDNTVIVWELIDNDFIIKSKITKANDFIQTFTVKENLLALGTTTGIIEVRNMKSINIIEQSISQLLAINCLVFKGELLLIGGSNKAINIWPIPNDKVELPKLLGTHEYLIRALI